MTSSAAQVGWSDCDHKFPGGRPCVVGAHVNHPHEHRPDRWLPEDDLARLRAAVTREGVDPVKAASVLREVYEILGRRIDHDDDRQYLAALAAAYVNDLANMLEDRHP